MLYVRITELTAKSIEWKIGNSKEAIHDAADAGKVQYIKADKQELALIKDMRFVNIRNVEGLVEDTITWYGEDARFIAGNL